jgi:hypothetical protein
VLSLYWLSRARLEDDAILPDTDAWFSRELRVFNITSASKPVSARYGNVQKLSPIPCTCVCVLVLPVSYLYKRLNFLCSLFLTIFSQALIDDLARHSDCDFRQTTEGARPAWDSLTLSSCSRRRSRSLTCGRTAARISCGSSMRC